MASSSWSPPSPSVVISSRCSFQTLDAFRAAEQELLAAHPADASARRDIRRLPTKFVAPEDPRRPASPVFVTSVRSESKFALKTDAAKKNDHAKTPYAPPSEFQHRLDSPPAAWKSPDSDFLAKFHIASNQDLRRRTALDQEGFFTELPAGPRSPPSGVVGIGGNNGRTGPNPATELTKADQPGVVVVRRLVSPPTSPCASPPSRAPTATPETKQDFQTRVPHTTRKSSNVELRLETIVDQDGLLPQLREIRDHQYRQEAPASAAPFHAMFKPAPSLRPIGGMQ